MARRSSTGGRGRGGKCTRGGKCSAWSVARPPEHSTSQFSHVMRHPRPRFRARSGLPRSNRREGGKEAAPVFDRGQITLTVMTVRVCENLTRNWFKLELSSVLPRSIFKEKYFLEY
eukprot:581453-Prorocentrum_minimum.AAC.3